MLVVTIVLIYCIRSRPCPNCSVMINRDEGCNKVDCLLCGYRFCWRCGSGWSAKTCGFYQCGENDTSDSTKVEDKVTKRFFVIITILIFIYLG